jgi:polyisoprenoid-binding protein YceI
MGAAQMTRQFFSILMLIALGFSSVSDSRCYAATIPPQTIEASTWTIDPAHSKPSFSIRHMMISNVTGCFDKVAGTVRYDGKNLSNAYVEATIDASSIDTSNAQRDTHLKSPDFLDTAKYPTITFKSKTIAPMSDHQAKITGDLTMHGVTKEIILDLQEITPEIKDPRGKTRVGATATATLNRKDFGISFNATMDNGGAMVGDQVSVSIAVELVKN